MKKRCLLLLCALLLPALLGGCNNYSEIEDNILVGGIAIDLDSREKVYDVTVEMIKIGSSKEEEIKSELISMNGYTIFDALRSMVGITSKRLFLSHATTIIISEEIAAQGLLPVIDIVMRDDQIRITNDIIIARNTPARTLLEQKSIDNPIKSYEIQKTLENNRDNLSVTPRVTIYDVINKITGKGICPTLPAYSVSEESEESTFMLDGTGIFKGDRLVGFLDIAESKILTMLLNKTKGGVLLEKVELGNDVYLTPEIYSCRVDTNPVFEGTAIKMEINIDITAAINEITTAVDILSEEGQRRVVDELEQRLKTQVISVISKVQQEFNADIFGFGNTIYKKNPEKWTWIENNEIDYFKEIEPEVTVKMDLRGTGFVNKQLKLTMK